MNLKNRMLLMEIESYQENIEYSILLVLSVCRICINSSVNSMSCLLGKYNVISRFIIFVSSEISVGICDINGHRGWLGLGILTVPYK